jgi:hypothetical protein
MIPSVHTLEGAYGALHVVVASSPEVQALSHRALRVYLVLLARHNAKRDGWAWSMTGLARDTGIHRDHITDAVRRLERDGLVEVQRGLGSTCTHYRLLVPPSLRVVGATVAPTHRQGGATVAPTVGAKSAPTHKEDRAKSAPTVGATVAPSVGATVAPTLQRDYNDSTEEPPYPHTDPKPANPPSPPASRGEHEGAPPRFELPERMRNAKRPEGFWRQREAAERARAVAPAPAPERELPPMPTRGDAVRQLARDLGVRPREARKMLEREEIIASRPEVPPPAPVALTDDMARELMRDFGWSKSELASRYGWTPGEA